MHRMNTEEIRERTDAGRVPAGEERNEEKEQKSMEDSGSCTADGPDNDMCRDLACGLLCDRRHEVLQVTGERQSNIRTSWHAKECRKERKE